MAGCLAPRPRQLCCGRRSAARCIRRGAARRRCPTRRTAPSTSVARDRVRGARRMDGGCRILRRGAAAPAIDRCPLDTCRAPRGVRHGDLGLGRGRWGCDPRARTQDPCHKRSTGSGLAGRRAPPPAADRPESGARSVDRPTPPCSLPSELSTLASRASRPGRRDARRPGLRLDERRRHAVHPGPPALSRQRPPRSVPPLAAPRPALDRGNFGMCALPHRLDR